MSIIIGAFVAGLIVLIWRNQFEAQRSRRRRELYEAHERERLRASQLKEHEEQLRRSELCEEVDTLKMRFHSMHEVGDKLKQLHLLARSAEELGHGWEDIEVKCQLLKELCLLPSDGPVWEAVEKLRRDVRRRY